MVMQEQRQQSMADYAAELQAQIAEKERRKRLQRQNSLRESQDLLAQRMTVPSGLVRLTFAVFQTRSHPSCLKRDMALLFSMSQSPLSASGQLHFSLLWANTLPL